MSRPLFADLAGLVADPENARAHSARNLDAISASLGDVGAARSIVIDENNVILAGNGVASAAAAAGITTVQVVEADGSALVAVRRRGLSPEAKRRLAIADNRTAELATWDAETLARQLAEIATTPEALAALGFSAEEAARLWKAEPAAPTEFSVAGETAAYKCPSCGYEWSGNAV